MMGKLAICVPTLNRTDVVEEVLAYCAGYLKKYDVDIYYYDSGEKNDLQRIVGEYRCAGYSIYYVEVPADYMYGDKIDYIFAGKGRDKDYDYIWPIKDRNIPNERMLELVLERCDGKSDIVVSLTLGNIYEGEKFNFNSPIDLYRYFARQITSLETVVYNTRTMFDDYVFGDSKKCSKAKNDFWHYWYVFNKLAQIDEPLIAVVSREGAINMHSSVPSGNNWRKRIFDVWIEEFIRINYELPDIYSVYKTKVIKDTVSIPELLGTEQNFIELHNEGILTAEVFKKYECFWEFVTNVPIEVISRIAFDST